MSTQVASSDSPNKTTTYDQVVLNKNNVPTKTKTPARVFLFC
jgi:hypothetical protein